MHHPVQLIPNDFNEFDYSRKLTHENLQLLSGGVQGESPFGVQRAKPVVLPLGKNLSFKISQNRKEHMEVNR